MHSEEENTTSYQGTLCTSAWGSKSKLFGFVERRRAQSSSWSLWCSTGFSLAYSGLVSVSLLPALRDDEGKEEEEEEEDGDAGEEGDDEDGDKIEKEEEAVADDDEDEEEDGREDRVAWIESNDCRERTEGRPMNAESKGLSRSSGWERMACR